MPNIYLRLPLSRCQFIRNRDPNHVLSKCDPLVFNSYMPEHFILRNSLTPAVANCKQINMTCFSQQQWRNMMQGRHPLGGSIVIKRDVHQYLSYGEVQYLNGKLDYAKTMNEDYLCIKLPNEVEMVDVVKSVTPSWTIDTNGVRRLLTSINNDFKRSIVEWSLSTFDYCTSKGRLIARSRAASLERYLMRYGIEPTTEEKDNLRRIVNRWLSTEHANYKSFSCFDMQYGDAKESCMHIDEIQWL